MENRKLTNISQVYLTTSCYETEYTTVSAGSTVVVRKSSLHPIAISSLLILSSRHNNWHRCRNNRLYRYGDVTCTNLSRDNLCTNHYWRKRRLHRSCDAIASCSPNHSSSASHHRHQCWHHFHESSCLKHHIICSSTSLLGRRSNQQALCVCRCWRYGSVGPCIDVPLLGRVYDLDMNENAHHEERNTSNGLRTASHSFLAALGTGTYPGKGHTWIGTALGKWNGRE